VAADWADGPFDLPDPTVGLADLAVYVATMTVTFSGTQAGNPIDASTTTTLSVAPDGRVLTIERGPDGPTTFRAEIAGAAYVKEGDGPCTVGSIVEGDTLADAYELAAQLPPLAGAADAGSGTVNGTAALQHTFDRSSVMMLGIGSASGEVWTAETGGQVVRYRLAFEVAPGFGGEDTTGTRTLAYELTVPAKTVALKLPDDCPPQLPLLADATDIDRWSDLLTFRSTMPVGKAAKSYGALMKRLGWKPAVPQDVSKEMAVLAFRKRGSVATVIMRGDPEGIVVKVALTRQPAGHP
jgi:hypothetical protein